MNTILFPIPLAQEEAPKPTRAFSDWSMHDSVNLIMTVGALIVAIVIFGMILMYFRRKMHERESSLQSPGSIMEELRRLRKGGVLSEAEYEASRRAAATRLAAAQGAATPDSKPAPRPIAPAPPKPMRQASKPTDHRTAPPGFDLTGAPLPKPADESP